ncbi:MAG: DUF1841 family protein [Acetobacteraceae bacterium]
MTIDSYDPLQPPDPAVWQEASSEDRIRVVRAYHEAAGMSGSALTVHGGLHVTVENQIALNDPPIVAVKVQQLMAQGLDRHQALHAVASVLIDHMRRMTAPGRRPMEREALAEAYIGAVRRLNARKWLKS